MFVFWKGVTESSSEGRERGTRIINPLLLTTKAHGSLPDCASSQLNMLYCIEYDTLAIKH